MAKITEIGAVPREPSKTAKELQPRKGKAKADKPFKEAIRELPSPQFDPGSNAGLVDGVQYDGDRVTVHNVSGTIDLRFADPLVAEIVQLHRMRRNWILARSKLILQSKALCRAFVGGDIDMANDLFEQAKDGQLGASDIVVVFAVEPFLHSIRHFDEHIGRTEKQIVKLAKTLPVAPWAEGIQGFGFMSLAAIVGEAGDLSVYTSKNAVWKRLCVALIGGERQRKCADADKALAHGYSPTRRSVLWNISESLARWQRTWIDKKTGEVKKEPGPYGVYLEAEKARQLAKGLSPAHAENRAKRHTAKRLLKHLWQEWRRIQRESMPAEEHKIAA